jgi:hypothetical protein
MLCWGLLCLLLLLLLLLLDQPVETCWLCCAISCMEVKLAVWQPALLQTYACAQQDLPHVALVYHASSAAASVQTQAEAAEHGWLGTERP